MSRRPQSVAVEGWTLEELAAGISLSGIHVGTEVGKPYRAGGGTAPMSETGGWWAVRVRTSLGGESVLQWDPDAQTATGVLWVGRG